MKKTSVLLTAIALSLSLEAFSQTAQIGSRLYSKEQGSWYVEENGRKFAVNQEVITIKFREGHTPAELSVFEKTYGLVLVRKNMLGYIDYNIPKDADVIALVQRLSSSPLIESVDINATGSYTLIPNDPSFASQYSLNQTSDKDIDAPEAWNITTGSSSVRVGILDSGTDWTHEDMGLGTDSYQNIYLNSGEDAWTSPNNPATGNGVDNDGNGLVDDWKGWNWDQNTNDSRGTFFHGTHVAGITGAKTNNAKGISGVAGGFGASGSKMLIVNVGQNAPNGAVLDDAILYAAQQGVKVIQLSLTVPQTAAIDAAINSANNTFNALVVCASGNNSATTIGYPASHPLVFSVGATDANDVKASFSNSGTNLEIAAPGVNILSTQIGNTYANSSGTSFAAPIVSGVAALILSVNPCLKPKDIKEILRATAEKVGGYNYYWDPARPGHSKELGYGRVNAFKAVELAQAMYKAGADLYSRDTPADFGVEPNPDSGPMWISQDIWVRNQNDGLTNQTHQNPEFTLGQPVYVYVRVRNKGCASSSGSEKLKLYYSKASTGLSWPTHWNGYTVGSLTYGDIIGTQNISAVTSGGETILTYTWQPPNPNNFTDPDKNHWCLLARIETSTTYPFGMTFAETSDVNYNTNRNNNIVWKNVTVTNVIPGIANPGSGVGGGKVIVRNVQRMPVNTSIHFRVPDEELNNSVLQKGAVKVDLGTLFEKWEKGGRKGRGVEVVYEPRAKAPAIPDPGATALPGIGPVTGTDIGSIGVAAVTVEVPILVITRPDAQIDNIPLEAEEMHDIAMEFTQTVEIPAEGKNQYLYDVIQYDASRDPASVVGGERYVVNYLVGQALYGKQGSQRKAAQGNSSKTPAEEAFEKEISIYPNPARSSITFEVPGENSLLITDLTGREAYRASFSDRHKADVSALPKGVYMAEITNASSHVRVIKRVVIQ
jgi:serine protease